MRGEEIKNKTRVLTFDWSKNSLSIASRGVQNVGTDVRSFVDLELGRWGISSDICISPMNYEAMSSARNGGEGKGI